MKGGTRARLAAASGAQGPNEAPVWLLLARIAFSSVATLAGRRSRSSQVTPDDLDPLDGQLAVAATVCVERLDSVVKGRTIDLDGKAGVRPEEVELVAARRDPILWRREAMVGAKAAEAPLSFAT